MEFGFEISEMALKIIATTLSIIFMFYFITKVGIHGIMTSGDIEIAKLRHSKQPQPIIMIAKHDECDCDDCKPTTEASDNESK